MRMRMRACAECALPPSARGVQDCDGHFGAGLELGAQLWQLWPGLPVVGETSRASPGAELLLQLLGGGPGPSPAVPPCVARAAPPPTSLVLSQHHTALPYPYPTSLTNHSHHHQHLTTPASSIPHFHTLGHTYFHS